MSEINFSWKDVPSGWALCFNQSCPLHEHCLRYQAGVLAPPGSDRHPVCDTTGTDGGAM